MKVYVAIELTGNSQEIDGAIILGVFKSAEGAENCIASTTRSPWVEFEVQECDLED